MIRLVSRKTALAAFTLACLLGLSTPARAGFVITIADTTNSVSKTFTFGAPVSGQTDSTFLGVEQMAITTQVGDIFVSVELARSNTPGTPSLSFVDQSGNGIVNTSTSARSLSISVTSTDFTAPTAPPALTFTSTLTANVVTGTVTAGTFNSYIGTTNGEFQQSIGAPTVGPASADATNPFSDFTQTQIASLTGPFSISSVLTATLSGSANITQLSGNSHLATAVPEPSSMVALAAGLPFLTVALRRRKASK